jgi:hypothetical protein
VVESAIISSVLEYHIYASHIGHVPGRDPDMCHLLDVQWNFSVASLIVACPGGCEGELYCSQSGVDSDLDSSHSLRCTGCKNESSGRSALWKFVDIFLVAAKAVTYTMLRYKKLKTHGASQGKYSEASFSILMEDWKPVSMGLKRRW